MAFGRLQNLELERLEHNRYAQRLGFVVDECAEGRSLVRLPVRTDTLNRGGRVHGGAIASGVLTAAMLAAASSERDPSARRTLPLHLAVSFLSAAGEQEISFAARVTRRGRSLVHTAIEAIAGAEPVASGLASHAIDVNDPGAAAGFHAAPASRQEGADLPPVRMSGSPYGLAAGIEVLSEVGSEARLRMPAAANAGEDGCADPGAITGLIDNCGAFATYVFPGVSIEQGGATVSMHVTFGPPIAEDLRAVGRVVGKVADAYANEVEVAGVASGLTVATATLVYRMRPAAAGERGKRGEPEDG